MVKKAKTLVEARRLLDPRPLAFGRAPEDPIEAAADPDFYEQPPPQDGGALRLPGPMDMLEDRLLSGGAHTKMFLSGHVGSGKSTELARLTTRPAIRERFTVITLRFEEQEWATLDSSQVLFRIAGTLLKHALDEDRLGESGRWHRVMDDLDRQLNGENYIVRSRERTRIETPESKST